LHNLEEAQRLLEAEEACDDPLRMVPYLLEHKAVRGQVIAINMEHRERAVGSMVRRPLVTLRSAAPCVMPLGKELWWSEQPAGREYVLEDIQLEAEGLAVLNDGLVQLALAVKRDSEAVVGQGVILLESDGLAELNDGLVQSALIRKRVTEVVVG